MPEHRRKFSPQFRAEAVQMVISTGRLIALCRAPCAEHPVPTDWPGWPPSGTPA